MWVCLCLDKWPALPFRGVLWADSGLGGGRLLCGQQPGLEAVSGPRPQGTCRLVQTSPPLPGSGGAPQCHDVSAGYGHTCTLGCAVPCPRPLFPVHSPLSPAPCSPPRPREAPQCRPHPLVLWPLTASLCAGLGNIPTMNYPSWPPSSSAAGTFPSPAATTSLGFWTSSLMPQSRGAQPVPTAVLP